MRTVAQHYGLEESLIFNSQIGPSFSATNSWFDLGPRVILVGHVKGSGNNSKLWYY